MAKKSRFQENHPSPPSVTTSSDEKVAPLTPYPLQGYEYGDSGKMLNTYVTNKVNEYLSILSPQQLIVIKKHQGFFLVPPKEEVLPDDWNELKQLNVIAELAPQLKKFKPEHLESIANEPHDFLSEGYFIPGYLGGRFKTRYPRYEEYPQSFNVLSYINLDIFIDPLTPHKSPESNQEKPTKDAATTTQHPH